MWQDYVDLCRVTFQSHYGAIATIRCFVMCMRNTSFQSHYGAIATVGSQTRQIASDIALSIPLWCDCNNAKLVVVKCPLFLSIPLWCDCNYHPAPFRSPFHCLSIPLWCDCNLNISGNNVSIYHLSIPLWCDCNAAVVEGANEKYFQSHYGAIATQSHYGTTESSADFQSHYGAIATATPSVS